MADMKILGDLKPLGAHLNVKAPSIGAEPSRPFGEVLKESLNEVNKLQVDADRAVEDLVTGKNANIHETMISISKADLAFRMTMQVRNKIIEAYQEVMRMNI